MATGREHSVCQDSGVSHIFILIIHNREKVVSIVNVMVRRRVTRENSSLPLPVRVSKSRVLKLPIVEILPRNRFKIDGNDRNGQAQEN